jgi:AcrR family transcriptional regulator
MAKGRPRGFDVGNVLEAALGVFWAKGYEGTTMADLTAATKLKAGSLYAAFGSKAGLFAQVVDYYTNTVFAYAAEALKGATAREVARLWLHGAVAATTGATTPPGCLLVQGALVAGDASTEAQKDLRLRRHAGEAALAERFSRARQQGDLPETVDPRDAATYVLTLSQGIAVQAASGASRADLRRLADLALARLPWE